ncbi:TetR/AcrR family transcriptional regulator [Nocardiopsis oceani]
MTGPELPLMGQEQAPSGRADAVRNRRAILDAAQRLFAEQGPGAVTMNAVARAAGMGVGTVYRRFGDVGQLLAALMDEDERHFQESFLNGPPPLGPGAPAHERLRAFLHALTDRMVERFGIMRAVEEAEAGARHRGGAYRAMHAHVSILLRESRPGAQTEVLAHMLLAPFVPSLLGHLIEEREIDVDTVKRGIDDLLGSDLSGERA